MASIYMHDCKREVHDSYSYIYACSLHETHESDKSSEFLKGPRRMDVREVSLVQLRVGDEWLHILVHFN